MKYIEEQKFENTIILNEPLNEWTFLDLFYKDMKKNWFSFQLEILITKYKQLFYAINKNPKLIIMERSLKTGIHKYY